MKRLVETPFDQPLSKPLDRSRPARECLGNTLVSPIGTIGIGLQQNLGTPNLLTGPFQLFHNGLKLRAALDPSVAPRKSSAWHTSLCHAASPIRPNLPTRHFSRDRALVNKTSQVHRRVVLEERAKSLRPVPRMNDGKDLVIDIQTPCIQITGAEPRSAPNHSRRLAHS